LGAVTNPDVKSLAVLWPTSNFVAQCKFKVRLDEISDGLVLLKSIKAANAYCKEKVFLLLTDLGVGCKVVFVSVVLKLSKFRNFDSSSKQVDCEDYYHHS
jgi:hypothetical protein